jgi:hypothetical protein
MLARGRPQAAPTPVSKDFPAFFGVSYLIEYTFAL